MQWSDWSSDVCSSDLFIFIFLSFIFFPRSFLVLLTQLNSSLLFSHPLIYFFSVSLLYSIFFITSLSSPLISSRLLLYYSNSSLLPLSLSLSLSLFHSLCLSLSLSLSLCLSLPLSLSLSLSLLPLFCCLHITTTLSPLSSVFLNYFISFSN